MSKQTRAARTLPPMSSEEGYRWRRKAKHRKRKYHRLRKSLKALLK